MSGEPRLENLADRVRSLEDEVRRLERDAGRQIAKLKILNEIGRSIAAVLDVDRILELICELVTANLDCDLSSVMLVENGGDLVMRAARGIPDEIARKIRVKVGQGYAGKVAQSGRAILVTESAPPPGGSGRLPAISKERKARYHGGSFAVAPILLEGQVLGVINVTNKRGDVGLGPDDLEFLETVAAYAAVAIENARLHAKAQFLAATDGLTDLYNHRYFQERLAEEVERWRRYWVKGVALVMLDIDRFKRFNDRYGHRAGDAVLRETAQRIKRQARKVDVCCRYGGEEFAVILPEIDKPGARTFAERVREAIAGAPFNFHRDVSGSITVSVGVAICPEHAMDAGELIEAADRALFASKNAGRNRVSVAGDLPVPATGGAESGSDSDRVAGPGGAGSQPIAQPVAQAAAQPAARPPAAPAAPPEAAPAKPAIAPDAAATPASPGAPPAKPAPPASSPEAAPARPAPPASSPEAAPAKPASPETAPARSDTPGDRIERC